MSIGEHTRDHGPAAARGRSSRVELIADERSGVSPEASNNHLAATMRAGLRRGPLLAVCGLCGGAGASTLACLTALAAARTNKLAVLLADTGGTTAGVSHYTGVEAPRSLAELAELIAAGLPVGRLLATTSDGLRVLASAPRFTAGCARAGIELLLDQARERYALTVVDCGTLAREGDQVVLDRASHVAWVLPATPGAIARARSVVDAVDPPRAGSELVVARAQGNDQKATMTELKRLARDRRATLILLPDLPDLATAGAATAIELAQVPLQAILGALSRP